MENNIKKNKQTNLTVLIGFISGDNRIPVSAVFQLTRLAFCYEQWDIFDSLAEPLKVFQQLSLLL